jgi:hypothetical protein
LFISQSSASKTLQIEFKRIAFRPANPTHPNAFQLGLCRRLTQKFFRIELPLLQSQQTMELAGKIFAKSLKTKKPACAGFFERRKSRLISKNRTTQHPL